jgi:hypothetical protein
MSRLDPAKLHVQWQPGTTEQDPIYPRRYTLTHSDATGDLFLTIGADYDTAKLQALYTRLMRDEVLSEWSSGEPGAEMHVFCHVSGGLAFGTASMRDAIFRRELPLVLEALRHGDRAFFAAHPGLDSAPVVVHFRSGDARFNRTEIWGTPADYQLAR